MLAVPPEVRTPSGERGRLLAFLAHGRHGAALCSTDSTARDGLGMVFLTEIVEHDTQPVGTGPIDVVRTWIPTHEDMTVGDMVNQAQARFETSSGPRPGDDRWTTYLTTMVSTAVATLLYACADDADIAVLPGAPGRRPSHKPKRGQVFGLGWNTDPGDAIDAAVPRPGHLHTYWPHGLHAPARLTFHAQADVESKLAALTEQFRSARAELHARHLQVESLHAEAVRAQQTLRRLQADNKAAHASRRRLVHAVLRYRGEAAETGSVSQLAALRRQLSHRDEDLRVAHETIAALSDELDVARDALTRRSHTAWERADGDDKPKATRARPDEHVRFSSWDAVLDAARQDLRLLWFAPDLLDDARQLPARRDWLSTTWNTLCALSDYAHAKITASTATDRTAVRNLRAYLDAVDVDGRRISSAQLVPAESRSVLNNPSLRRHRERPAPPSFGGTALYTAHVRIGQSAPHPRLYFVELGGEVCIGYLGPHLPNRLTT
ncbi:hypothetical protein ADL03_15240 [Nocardia sp. NRRL S-836]|nr:hypothetical protein ADL03_15240 [Nocardia sp. NRRL S-836]